MPLCSSRSLIFLLLSGAVLGACDRQSAQTGQENAVTPGEVTSGEMPASGADTAKPAYVIDRGKAGDPLPDFVFSDEQARDVTLERFAGKPILINLWATWCAPCIAEMPQLDRIAERYAKDKLQVLTISQDSLGAEKVLPFFEARKFRHLRPWLDPENQFGFHYATGLLPTSILYDAEGREVARISGALDWEGEEAKALIEEAIEG